MSGRAPLLADEAISFGPFRLFPARQLLLEADKPQRLGSRAFGILVALIERAGELVTKEELVAKVWPNIFVEESSLRVHMAALRRTLGDGQAGNRYIATIPGRGYRFVAELNSVEGRSEPGLPIVEDRKHNLPMLPTRMVGRGEQIDSLVRHLRQSRFITLVGPGGIGKTTVALAAAEALLANYANRVCFVSFAAISDALLVPNTVAFALGLPIRTDRTLDELIAFLVDKKTLLVLDGCEHVIDPVAAFAERIFESAPGVHILATSREPLRAGGERVQRLRSLETPISSQAITADVASTYSAIQLFVERATAVVEDFVLDDTNAPVVSEICRRLDGIPLAIEMAAGRINAFAPRELAAQLDNRFALLTQGRRTALQRHQTLRATLDWSYEQLPQVEREILNRIAVFTGVFSLESVRAVVVNGEVVTNDIVPGIANLVEKSLVAADVANSGVLYRLLDTTRAYAMEKLIESGERERLTRRHAEHYRDLCERVESEWETRPTAEWLAAYRVEIDDIRSALDWAFSPDGDPQLGVALTVAAVPLWLQLSLINESRVRIERALTIPDKSDQSVRHKMKLYTALGWALIYTSVSASGTAWSTALELADSLDDTDYRLRALRGMWAASQTVGDFNNSLVLAKRFQHLAVGSTNPSDSSVGDRMMGAALHFIGDQVEAEKYTRRALSHYITPNHRSDVVRFQYDQRVSARSVLARILWVKGVPDQALREAMSTVEYAQSIDHVISLCNTLAQSACAIAIRNGDLDLAERFASMLIEYAEQNAQQYLHTYGECFRGLILIRRGDLSAGLALGQAAINKLRAAQSAQHLMAFLAAFAEGSGRAGKIEQGFAAIDEALGRSEQYGGRWCIAELLRIKGELIRNGDAPNAAAEATDYFRQALDWARRQGALSWELRAATSLGGLLRDQRRCAEALAVVQPVYERFTEGFGTSDLIAAKALIDDLR
jgi:predicted ATPase/DNA-binding winged helix-turn-helix (wHTH) protein